MNEDRLLPEGYGWGCPAWSEKYHVAGPDGHPLCAGGPAFVPGPRTR